MVTGYIFKVFFQKVGKLDYESEVKIPDSWVGTQESISYLGDGSQYRIQNVLIVLGPIQ